MEKKKKKILLEEKLLRDGLFEDTKEIARWVMAGQILVDEQTVMSAKIMVKEDAQIRVKEYYKRKYVNKGGLKLERAIEEFRIDVKGRVALDCGASTGGFTDCLITCGARKVYAVDVGYGQLAGKLAADKRVVNMEKTNLSDEKLHLLDEKPEIITLDLSYLSLKKAVPICEEILGMEGGIVICLVKPLFEVESSEIRRTGEISSEEDFAVILNGLVEYFCARGYEVFGVTNSPVTGNGGTIEFFMGLKIGGTVKKDKNKVELGGQIKMAIKNGLELKKFKKSETS